MIEMNSVMFSINTLPLYTGFRFRSGCKRQIEYRGLFYGHTIMG